MEEAEILLRNAMEHHGAAVYRLALCRMQSVQDAEDCLLYTSRCV